MLRNAKRLAVATLFAVAAVSIVLPGEAPVEARGPFGARYCSTGDQVFWFVQATDPHVGIRDSSDTDNLRWLLTTARQLINPLFTVVTGDLTDSTNGNLFGYPNGPYQAEWIEYRGVLDAAGVTAADYYDLPGNHDAYNDRYFGYYRTYAVQGPTYAQAGQVAWTTTLPGIGTYHFVGVNTADNTGAPFSLLSPYGDHAGLDDAELAALSADLGANAPGANLSFAFGHHPVTSTGDSADTYLYYGAQAFVGQLDGYQASAYQYGHVHDNVETIFTGDTYTGTMTGAGVRYSRVASLGKDSPKSYLVVSVDCDGVNSVIQPVGTWPLVLVTAPVNRGVGTATNPYVYDVPAASSNPIRTLVFDAGPVGSVRFRIDGGTAWTSMNRVSGTAAQWEGTWDASGVSPGEHTIEVQAAGTTTRSHTIKVNVAGTPNRPPVSANDSYSTRWNAALSVPAPGVLANDSDPEGVPLTAQVVAWPAKGNLTLNTDGSFTYTPMVSVAGTDTFTYTASDGVLVSAAATVSITLTAPPPSNDTVTIKTATYTRKTSTLLVQATSSAAPAATLTVAGYGTMTYNTKTKLYSYSQKPASNPGSVTVTSSSGGTATKTVTVK